MNIVSNFPSTSYNRYAAYSVNRKMESRREALTSEEIAIVAPSVFAEQEHDSRSDRYNFIDTREILGGLAGEGWLPVWVNEQRIRNKERAGFQKHIMRFRHADQIGTRMVGDEFPEIVLINSHDGSSSFQIHAGLFRLVCGNGMVIANSTFERLCVTHLNDADAVINAALQVPGRIPTITDKIERMKSANLPEAAQLALAESAAILRFGSLEESPVKPETLLTTRRRDDAGSDLWKTFNRVQENTTKGGIRFVKRDPEKGLIRGRVREVKGIDQNTNLNKALWHLAERLGEAFAA